MTTSTAIAFRAKEPLGIVERDLEGPKPSEALVELKGRRMVGGQDDVIVDVALDTAAERQS